MKTIWVVTYCERDSYGSIMQALALKNKLLQLGYNSKILKLPDKNNVSKIEYYFPKSRGQLVILLNRVFNKKKIESRMKKTNQFIKNNLDFIYIDNEDEISDIVNDSCCLLAGSDQIWHPHLCNKLFFLDIPVDSKRISYAASMGITDIPADREEFIKNALNRFDALSVREYECASILGKLTDNEISVHIDPTYLFDSDFWEKYEERYDINKPYILVYPIYWSKQYSEELKKLRKKSKLDIIAVCNDWSRVYATKKLYDVSPGQFLWLIHHAEAVVTSSFHGIAFSTIYKKKCAIVNNPKAASRIDSVMKMLGIKQIGISNLLEDYNDYEYVDKNIREQTEAAEKYLKGCLPL